MIHNFTRYALSALLFAQFLLCSMLIVYPASCGAQSLEIHQLDVGQGDAALVIVRQPAGRELHSRPTAFTLLIDSGPKGKGRNVIVPYLRKLRIDAINAVVLTHYHNDHIGGVNEVLNSEVVLKCYDRGGSYDSKTFDSYVSISGLKRATLNAGDTLLAVSFPKSSAQCSIICVASGGNILNYGYTGTSDENTKSIAILLTYIVNADTFKFLTAGDLTASQESLLAIHDPFIHDLALLKISHHGSQTSTSPDVLQSFGSKAVFISCGDNNTYGHPHAETLMKLDDQKSIEHVYQTEQGDNIGEKSIVSGNIVIKVYPNGRYTIKTDRGLDSYHFGRKSSGHLLPTPHENTLDSGELGWKTQYHDSAISLSIRPPVYVQSISVPNILGTTLRRFNPMEYIGSVSINDNFNLGAYFVLVKTSRRIFVNKVLISE